MFVLFHYLCTCYALVNKRVKENWSRHFVCQCHSNQVSNQLIIVCLFVCLFVDLSPGNSWIGVMLVFFLRPNVTSQPNFVTVDYEILANTSFQNIPSNLLSMLESNFANQSNQLIFMAFSASYIPGSLTIQGLYGSLNRVFIVR